MDRGNRTGEIADIVCTVDAGIREGIGSCGDAEITVDNAGNAGDKGFYLEKDRAYRSENNVFEDYTDEERNRLFGAPPATVWENMQNFENYPEKKSDYCRRRIG